MIETPELPPEETAATNEGMPEPLGESITSTNADVSVEARNQKDVPSIELSSVTTPTHAQVIAANIGGALEDVKKNVENSGHNFLHHLLRWVVKRCAETGTTIEEELRKF